jgi:hypothetical protein
MRSIFHLKNVPTTTIEKLTGVKVIALSMAIMLGLSACGGGDSGTNSSLAIGNLPGANSPTLATATAIGSITGFGSVIVDGVKYEDGQAKVTLDEKGLDVSSTTADLKGIGILKALFANAAAL